MAIRPDDLDLTSCARWLVQEAFSTAETDVLGVEPERAVPLDEAASDHPGTPPDVLTTFREQVALLDETATPRERQLLLLLAEHGDTDDLAPLLGIAPSTVRVLRRNLRKKAPELASVLALTASNRRAAEPRKKAAAI